MNSIRKGISRLQGLKNNQYLLLWANDLRFRTLVSLYGTFICNAAFAVFQLCLGLYHQSFWYFSLAAYYGLLSVMRLLLLKYTRSHTPGTNMRAEYLRYLVCGAVFLAMNLALSVMLFFMVYWQRSFVHHPITAIGMATYTFAAFTIAIINWIKFKKYISPVLSACKAISLASACVSVLTLEATMLTAFGKDMPLIKRNILLGTSGGAVCIFVIALATHMIIRARKALYNQKPGANEHERKHL